MLAASVLTGCTDVLDIASSVDRGQLAVLQLQGGTPAVSSQQFYVANNRQTTRTLVHPDAAGNQYAQVRFPSGSLATINGRTATASDSVLVTVQPEPGAYGLTIGTSGTVTFASTARPTATFFYGRYGDLTGSRSGSRYTTNVQLAQALELWREELVGRFSAVAGSGASGTDAVGGPVSAAGIFLVAAPK